MKTKTNLILKASSLLSIILSILFSWVYICMSNIGSFSFFQDIFSIPFIKENYGLLIILSIGFLVLGVSLLNKQFIQTSKEWLDDMNSNGKDTCDKSKRNFNLIPFSLFSRYYLEVGLLLFAGFLFLVAVFAPMDGQMSDDKYNYHNNLTEIQDTLSLQNKRLFILEKHVDELITANNGNSKQVIIKEVKIENSNTSLRIFIVVLAMSSIMTALVLRKKHLKAKIAATIIATITSSLALTINIDKLGFDFSFPIEINLDLITDSISHDLHPVSLDTLCIYPFKVGTTEMQDRSKKHFLGFIKKFASDNIDIAKIYISGSFDKRELNDNLTKKYGSNVGLAQARVNAVRKIIREHHFLDSVLIVPFVKGPEIYDTIMTEKRLEKDRSVFIVVEYLEKVRNIK